LFKKLLLVIVIVTLYSQLFVTNVLAGIGESGEMHESDSQEVNVYGDYVTPDAIVVTVPVYIGSLLIGYVTLSATDGIFEYAFGRSATDWLDAGVANMGQATIDFAKQFSNWSTPLGINVEPNTGNMNRYCVSYPCPIAPASEEDLK
jgi:hypothetical protein